MAQSWCMEKMRGGNWVKIRGQDNNSSPLNSELYIFQPASHSVINSVALHCGTDSRT